MIYSCIAYFFSLKFRKSFGQVVLYLVHKIVHKLIAPLLLTLGVMICMTCMLEVSRDSLSQQEWDVQILRVVWADPSPPRDLQSKYPPPHKLQTADNRSRAPLSDQIPADALYAFGHDPAITGQVYRSLSLASLSSWWILIRDRAAKQETQWTDEERDAWREFAALPLPKSPQDWLEMGVERMPRFWVYGLGLTPALVVELPDPERFRTWVQRHIDAERLGFKERAHSGGVYWRKRLKRWTLLTRLDGKHLYFAIIPQAAEPILLSFFLRKQHIQNLTPVLKRALSSLPRDARGSGFIRLNLIIDLFFGSQKPLLKYSGEALGLPSSFFASCEKDLRSIVETLPSITLGLSDQSDQSPGTASHQSSPSTYQIYTHLEVTADLLKRLRETQHGVRPIWVPPTQEALGLGMRFKARLLSSLFSDLGQKWREAPWTCRPLRGLNQLLSFTERPQYIAGINLLGELDGLTLQVFQESRQLNSLNSGSQLSTLFSGWIELIHPQAPLLLQLLYTGAMKTPTPPQYLKPNSILHDLSVPLPHLPSPLLSLSSGHVRFSIGTQGQKAHQKLLTASPSQEPSSPPLIWLEIPPKLSAWLEHRLSPRDSKIHDAPSSTSLSPKIKKTTPPHETKKSPQLRTFKARLNSTGLMIESTLVVKSL